MVNRLQSYTFEQLLILYDFIFVFVFFFFLFHKRMNNEYILRKQFLENSPSKIWENEIFLLFNLEQTFSNTNGTGNFFSSNFYSFFMFFVFQNLQKEFRLKFSCLHLIIMNSKQHTILCSGPRIATSHSRYESLKK